MWITAWLSTYCKAEFSSSQVLSSKIFKAQHQIGFNRIDEDYDSR